MTLNLLEHDDDLIPAHLKHSYAIAIAEAVANGELHGYTRGTRPLNDEQPHLSVPATVLFAGPAHTSWRTAWLRKMNALKLPNVATAQALAALPFITPSLLEYLITQEMNAPARPARSPSKTKGSGSKGETAVGLPAPNAPQDQLSA